jgi:hypothetical protein
LAQVDKITGYGKTDDEKETVRKLLKQIVDELRADLMKIPGADPSEVEAIVLEKERELISEFSM